MKPGKSKRIIAIMLAIIMSVMVIPSCSGGKDGFQKDVAKGRRVFISQGDQGDTVYFGYKDRLCTAQFKEGEMSGFTAVADAAGDIYSLAVYDGALYVSTGEGVFRYGLAALDGQGGADPEALMDRELSAYGMFEIYDGKLFFMDGSDLCCMPVDGGEETTLASDVRDFEVTDSGIYFSKKDGSLHLLGTDLREDREVGRIAVEADMSPGSGAFYYVDNSELFAYSVDKGENKIVYGYSADVEMRRLDDSGYPWVNGKVIIFKDEDGGVHLLKHGSWWDDTIDGIDRYPFKDQGCIYGDWLVSRTKEDSLSVISFDDGSFRDYDLRTELAE